MTKLVLTWPGRARAKEDVIATPATITVRAEGEPRVPVQVRAFLCERFRGRVELLVDNAGSRAAKIRVPKLGLFPALVEVEGWAPAGSADATRVGAPNHVWAFSPLGRRLAVATWILSLPLVLALAYTWLSLPKLKYAEAWNLIASTPFVAYFWHLVRTFRSRARFFDLRRGGAWFLACAALLVLTHFGFSRLRNDSGKTIRLAESAVFEPLSVEHGADVVIPLWNANLDAVPLCSERVGPTTCCIRAGQETKTACGYESKTASRSSPGPSLLTTIDVLCRRNASMHGAIAKESDHTCELDKPILYDGARVRDCCSLPKERRTQYRPTNRAEADSEPYLLKWKGADPLGCDMLDARIELSARGSSYVVIASPTPELGLQIATSAGPLEVPKAALAAGLDFDIHSANGTLPGDRLGTLRCVASGDVRVVIEEVHEAAVAQITMRPLDASPLAWTSGWRSSEGASRRIVASCIPTAVRLEGVRLSYELELHTRFAANDQLRIPLYARRADIAVFDGRGIRLGEVGCDVEHGELDLGVVPVDAGGASDLSLVSTRPASGSDGSLRDDQQRRISSRWRATGSASRTNWAWFCLEPRVSERRGDSSGPTRTLQWADYTASRSAPKGSLVYRSGAFREPLAVQIPDCRAPTNGTLDQAPKDDRWVCQLAKKDPEFWTSTLATYWLDRKGCDPKTLLACRRKGHGG